MMVLINELPNEILVKILEKLSTSDLESCMDVCPRWSSVIDQVVGLSKYIGAGTSIWGNERFESIDCLPQIGTQFIAVSDLVAVEGQIPPFKYDYLVREVFLDAFITPKYVATLLKPLFNLRKLTVHLSALGHYSFEDESLYFQLPKLEIFSISQYGIGAKEDFVKGRQIVENLVYLLHSNAFSSLRSANLHLPFTAEGVQPMLCAILHFIAGHKRSLKKLIVSFEFTATIPTIPTSKKHLKPFFMSSLAGLRLKKLFVHCYKSNHDSMKVFEQILNMQSGTLQKVHFTTGFSTRIPSRVVETNWTTLTTFEMTIASTTSIDGPIDLSLFQHCHLLKILTLIGSPGILFNPLHSFRAGEKVMLLPDVINACCLPTSLQSVRLFNLFVSSSDVAFILLKLPKLTIANLHGIGTKGELGIRMHTLGTMVGLKQIKYFSCDFGFNRTSLHRPQSDYNNNDIPEDPYATLVGLFMSNLHPFGFVLEMDPGDGEYNIRRLSNSTLPSNINDPRIMIDYEANIEFALDNIEALFEDFVTFFDFLNNIAAGNVQFPTGNPVWDVLYLRANSD